MDKKKYIPISCSYYDELEAWATLKTNCLIVYRDNEGMTLQTEGLIKNLFTSNKEEFMHLDYGLQLRLDQLININGKAIINYC